MEWKDLQTREKDFRSRGVSDRKSRIVKRISSVRRSKMELEDESAIKGLVLRMERGVYGEMGGRPGGGRRLGSLGIWMGTERGRSGLGITVWREERLTVGCRTREED